MVRQPAPKGRFISHSESVSICGFPTATLRYGTDKKMKATSFRLRTLKAMGMGLTLCSGLIFVVVAIVAALSPVTRTNLIGDFFQFGFIAAVASVFSLAGWALVVLPLTYVPGMERLLGHVYSTEVIWILLALLAFGLVVMSWAGLDSYIIGWIPAVIGLCVGVSYRWLGSRREAGNEKSDTQT